MIAVPKIVRLVTADESVEFESNDVVIRHREEGVSIEPSKVGENTVGFLRLFFPWSEVRQIKEFDRA